MTERSRPSLSIGDVVELTITDLLANGQGVGRSAGMVVFAWGPLPRERARVRIEEVRPKYAVAELIEVLTPSPERSEPFCPVFGTCGGCQVQHLAYGAQLVWKRTLVENALRRIGGMAAVTVAPTIGMANPKAYRNKMALVVRHTEEGPRFGFYRARSHDIVTIPGCPVVRRELDEIIQGLWRVRGQAHVAPALVDVEHVVARSGSDGDAVVSLTTRERSSALAAAAQALVEGLERVGGICNSYDVRSANAVMGRKTVTLAGRGDTVERIAGLQFSVSPSSFFQINSEIVARIFEFLDGALPDARRVLDVYCGVGTFALFFARRGASVVGVEENPVAVREARASAQRNGMADRLCFLQGRAERVLRSGRGGEALGSSDLVFLDPPRKGSDEATLRTLAATAPRHVWYLSCNPATLARDVARLCEAGYRMQLVQPFDMFPQTGHVETLVALRRDGG